MFWYWFRKGTASFHSFKLSENLCGYFEIGSPVGITLIARLCVSNAKAGLHTTTHKDTQSDQNQYVTQEARCSRSLASTITNAPTAQITNNITLFLGAGYTTALQRLVVQAGMQKLSWVRAQLLAEDNARDFLHALLRQQGRAGTSIHCHT